MNKVKKNKRLIGRFGFWVLFMIIGFFGGYYGINIIDQLGFAPQNLNITIWQVILFLVIAYVLYLIQIIIHESGHYVFGRLTGYTFVSFRVGSLMLVRENGRLKLKKFSVPGTLGQCLLMPPNVKGESFPFLLYNLGGVIGNIISSLLSIILLILLPEHTWITIILVTNTIIGVFIASVNGIPLKLGVPNDGMNIYLLRDKHARIAFWLQLHINGLQAKGERLRNMPEEWFELPPDANFSNPLVSTILFFRCEYFMDKMEFEKVKSECQFIMKNVPGLLSIYKMELFCHLLFLEIIGDCRMDKIQAIFTKELKQYINATKIYISRRRLLYAYELLFNQDRDKADKQLVAFEKVARNYPVAAEVEREREILKVIHLEYRKDQVRCNELKA